MTGITQKDVIIFDTGKFRLNGNKLVDDPSAYMGIAYMLDAEAKGGVDNEYQPLNMTVNDIEMFAHIPGGYGHSIGIISGKDVIVDGKYYWYKFDNVIAVKYDEGYDYTYMFRDWTFQIPTMQADLAEKYMNKEVDIFISMKATGDVTYKDEKNLPKFYVDRIIVAPAEISSGSATIPTGNTVIGDGNGSTGSVTGTPGTGDNTPLAMGFAALLVSALGVVAVVASKKYSFRKV